MPAGTLQFFDNLLSAEAWGAVWATCSSSNWAFGHSSVTVEDPAFWKMELDSDPTVSTIWQVAQPLCERIAGHSLRVIRQYANGHTYGLGGQIHVDDQRADHYTLLYYPMPEWRAAWGGETVFYHPSGDLAAAVAPASNRAVFFDSRIAHAGRWNEHLDVVVARSEVECRAPLLEGGGAPP